MKKPTMAFTLGTAISGLLSSMGGTRRIDGGSGTKPEPTVDERIARGRLLPVPGKIDPRRLRSEYAHQRRAHKR